MTVPKVDLKRTLDGYRARVREFRLLELPAMRYLAVEGEGDPNTAASYAEALGAVYPVAYRTKFASRSELGRDYVVPPLEALWTAHDVAAFTTARDKSRWLWTALLLLPDWVPDALAEQAIAEVAATKAPAGIERVRVVVLEEGTVVQTLHVGPYDAEGPVLAEMHDRLIPGLGMRMGGHHHEIYLGDPRRVAPERLRTILRQPVVPA